MWTTPTSNRLAGCYALMTTQRREGPQDCDVVHGHQLDTGAGRLCRAGVGEPVMVFGDPWGDVVGQYIRAWRPSRWRVRRR